MSRNFDFVIEVCVDSLDSALAAYDAGSSGKIRLEICANLGVGGGITPSLGLVNSVRKHLPGVETMIMIRPRIGDFCYTENEIETMCEDIRIFKDAKVTGIVVGVLTPDGHVDIQTMQRLLCAAEGLSVTFHRAFDMTVDGHRALRDLASISGLDRILTSGQARSAPEGVDRLLSFYKLLRSLRSDLQLLIASGINAWSLKPLLAELAPLWHVKEIHLSGGEWVEGDCSTSARKQNMQMGASGKNEWRVWRTQRERIAAIFGSFMEFRLTSL